MKSRVTAKKKNEKEFLVSIGMIVKNEEEHLNKCLSALQNLMNRVSSELIIVDTGSTDKTKEIALKYTDKVYDFKWIDDFAAARNFGLEKAKGEWFMFIDADEYLDENCDELAEFLLKSEINKDYNFASYMIRNYLSQKGLVSIDFFGTRLARIRPATKFVGKIHEAIVCDGPSYICTTVFHHYGYLHDNDNNVFKKKRKRNAKLLKQIYEENPEDLSSITHLLDICEDYDECTKYLNEAFELIKNPRNKNLERKVYLQAIQIYTYYDKFDKALELCDDFLKLENIHNMVSIVSLDLYKAKIFMNKAEYQKSIKAFDEYFKDYQRYINKELDLFDMRVWSLRGISPSDYCDAIFRYADCCIFLNDYDTALEKLAQVPQDIIKGDEEFAKKYLSILINIADKKKDYKMLEKVLCDNTLSDEVREFAELRLNIIYEVNKESREDMVAQLSELPHEFSYFKYMDIIRRYNLKTDISDDIVQFINANNMFDARCFELVNMCMKCNIDITEKINESNFTKITDSLVHVAGRHEKFALTVNDYAKQINVAQSIKTMFFFVTAYAYSVANILDFDDEIKQEIFDNFICILSDYINNIYNPELLNDDDIVVLPDIHQFGYYMTNAFIARSNNDNLKYVKQLRKALASCKTMKNVVKFYMNKLKEKLDD